jgi:hypothetical protein
VYLLVLFDGVLVLQLVMRVVKCDAAGGTCHMYTSSVLMLAPGAAYELGLQVGV